MPGAFPQRLPVDVGATAVHEDGAPAVRWLVVGVEHGDDVLSDRAPCRVCVRRRPQSVRRTKATALDSWHGPARRLALPPARDRTEQDAADRPLSDFLAHRTSGSLCRMAFFRAVCVEESPSYRDCQK